MVLCICKLLYEEGGLASFFKSDTNWRKQKINREHNDSNSHISTGGDGVKNKIEQKMHINSKLFLVPVMQLTYSNHHYTMGSNCSFQEEIIFFLVFTCYKFFSFFSFYFQFSLVINFQQIKAHSIMSCSHLYVFFSKELNRLSKLPPSTQAIWLCEHTSIRKLWMYLV